MDAKGTVAQLGERRTEDAEAAGSSPASPTSNLLNSRVVLYSISLTKVSTKEYGYF